MSMIYLPSCKFTIYSPESSKKIKKYLIENYDIQVWGCCRPSHKKLTNEDTVVYICNSCAAFSREDSDAKKVISLWELLEDDENFLYPDYGHRRLAIQDCWRSYDNEPQQRAIRKILHKMNIDIEELDENFEKTRFCGTTLYEPLPKQNGEFAPKRFIENADGFFISHTEEEKIILMKEHCDTIESEEVICYCIACMEGINLGGKKGIHLLDLILGLEHEQGE